MRDGRTLRIPRNEQENLSTLQGHLTNRRTRQVPQPQITLSREQCYREDRGSQPSLPIGKFVPTE